jgi:predicted O-linked N-acetylglucosamine transferase (SPINDLY family)
MGVPRITLQGLTHRERVSSSFLTAAGYPELVATGVDEYVEIARGLANDLPRLAEMRATMRDKLLASPLMDIPAFVKRFEDALVRVFSAHDS